ncbi:Uncharacterised protein [Mycobacteroides abscessus subsp. abscessus]|nr:Uncharacterised protein [Mycobacteroides abscessus subsp. abscessus]
MKRSMRSRMPHARQAAIPRISKFTPRLDISATYKRSSTKSRPGTDTEPPECP